MLDGKVDTLLAVAEEKSFTGAARRLSLTQPAVSHHIAQLEQALGAPLFVRKKGNLELTIQGEIAVKYAKRFRSIAAAMRREISSAERDIRQLRVGVTHTSESNFVMEVLTRCGQENPGLNIIIITDTIKNLYTMLANFEVDIAIAEGKNSDPDLNSLMLSTDYLACVVSRDNPLAKNAMVTVEQLRRENLILRGDSSSTRMLFASALESIGESIDSFHIMVEVDNVATIKSLIQKDLGVSVLPGSSCMEEARKGKLAVLPIENLSMVRDTNLIYHKSFPHIEILQQIVRVYRDTARKYHGFGGA